ncbi:MAG: hypothetical protein A3E83_07805 [Gammaproteobacteria bacterium RIFCSPHIGHO2_12_FULL_41_20]|nr:MAG: hypothetical protein A3E83_07805 [Gammaproteobacteria bacterium RIFCSPHIGHO2_12_FULL_41_20]
MLAVNNSVFSLKAKLALVVAITFWASAFVAIRAALQGGYSPGGLALMRYLIASLCMFGVLFFHPKQGNNITFRDAMLLLLVGMVGIGCYNVTLNYSELTVPSGMASFIVSQSPLITTLLAVLFLNERIYAIGVLGFLVSIFGVALMTLGEQGGFRWNQGMICILLATFVGSLYSILQKPYLKKYHAIEVTAYVIWGGTLALLFFLPDLQHDLSHTSASANWVTLYLGVFPAAIGYIAWSYALAEVPAARAVSFLYFSPFIATLLGWLWLDEHPMLLSFLGGLLAILGVWLVNYSYRRA